MTALFTAAAKLQDLFESRGWRFCVIGGLALARWGEPRLTQDVDLTLFTGFGREEEFIRAILDGGYRERVPGAAAFATQRRVLLINASDGTPIDVSLAGLPYEELVVSRSSKFEFEPGCNLRTCSAEDLVVLKLFAARERDILDVKTVVIRQSGRLDWRYIEEQLRPLAELKEAPEIMIEMARLKTLDRIR